MHTKIYQIFFYQTQKKADKFSLKKILSLTITKNDSDMVLALNIRNEQVKSSFIDEVTIFYFNT